MELFKGNYEISLNQEFYQSLKTPLGVIKFDIDFGNLNLSDLKVNRYYKLKGNDFIRGWYTDFFDAELLICKYTPRLPSHLHVEGCFVTVYRVKMKESNTGCKFTAKWDNDYTWIDGGGNSGEDLDAQTWFNSEIEVSIGTEDGENLIERSQLNKLMPTHFDGSIEPLSIVQYERDGLIVPIPRLVPGQTVQVHFATAWAIKKEYDVSTWFSIDVCAENVLKQIGIQ